MKKVPLAITIVTLYAAVFQLSPYIGIDDTIIFSLFFLSPFLLLYMVYVILKFGKPSSYTFNERFYDDVNYFRNEVKKLES